MDQSEDDFLHDRLSLHQFCFAVDLSLNVVQVPVDEVAPSQASVAICCHGNMTRLRVVQKCQRYQEPTKWFYKPLTRVFWKCPINNVIEFSEDLFWCFEACHIKYRAIFLIIGVFFCQIILMVQLHLGTTRIVSVCWGTGSRATIWYGFLKLGYG